MCDKRTFSKVEAVSALNNTKNHAGFNKAFRKEKRMYYCEECNGWHLTSQEKKEKTVDYDLKFQNQWQNILNIQN